MSQLVCMNWSMHIVGWITTERPIRRFAKINSVVSCHLLCCCNDYGPSCFLQEYTTPWWIPYHLMIKGAKWVAYAVANSPCQGSIFIVLVAINVLSNRSSPRLTCFFFTQIWLNLNLKDLISDLYRFTVLVSLSLRSCVEHGEKLPSSRGYFFKELFDVFLCEFSAIPCCICMMISLHLLLLFLFSTVLQALWTGTAVIVVCSCSTWHVRQAAGIELLLEFAKCLTIKFRRMVIYLVRCSFQITLVRWFTYCWWKKSCTTKDV